VGWFDRIAECEGLEVWEGDVCDLGPEDLKGIVGVSHLASTAMPDFERKLSYYDAYVKNFEGTLNLVRCCKHVGVKRFVFASTTSVLGYRARDEEADESTKPEPDERYGEVKLMIESLLKRESGCRFYPVILRQGTVFGSSDRMRFDLVVNAMVRTSALEGKIHVTSRRDLCRPLVYIGDVAQAHILSLRRSPGLSGEIFHLAVGSFTLEEIAKRVQKVTKADIEYRESSPDRRSYRVSTRKAESLLFRPTVTIEEGAQEVLSDILARRFGDLNQDKLFNSRFLPKILGKERIHD